MNEERASQAEHAPWLSTSSSDSDAQEATALLRAALTQDREPVPPAIGARMRKRLEASNKRPKPKLLPELKAAIALSVALIFAYLVFAPSNPVQPQAPAERTIALADNSLMRLDADSRAQHQGLQVNLQHGRARLEVPALPAERKLRLRAGDTVVEGDNARFVVQHEAPRTQVWVERGTVQISRLSAVHHVKAGQRWDSMAPPTSQKTESPKTKSAKTEAPQAPTTTSLQPNPQAPLPASKSPGPNASAPLRSLRASSAFRPRPQRPRTGAAAPPPGSSPRFSAPPTQSQRSQLERAARATGAGQLELAKQIYTDLAKSEGRAAVLALYLHARLLSEQPAAALRLLEQIRAPRDPLAPEIELARIEAMLALGRCRGAQRAGARFSLRRPERVEMLRSLRNANCPKFFEQRPPKDH